MDKADNIKRILAILPTYNEAENIVNIVNGIKSVNMGISILIIDDNSPDGTGDIADDISRKDSQVRVIHRPCKMGLGTAYIEGFRYALNDDFDLIIQMDSDGQHDPNYIKYLVNLCKEYDLVIGSRYKNGIRFFNITLFRIFLATMANEYIKLIMGMDIADATSGYRCFRREVLEAIDLSDIYSKGFSFQIEMAYRVWKKGFKVYEHPIIFYNRNRGLSKISRQILFEALKIVPFLKLKVRK